MKQPPKFPCLMVEKEHAFTGTLSKFAIITNLRQFYGYKKQFNVPVYTYDQNLMYQARQHNELLINVKQANP